MAWRCLTPREGDGVAVLGPLGAHADGAVAAGTAGR